MRHSTTQRSNRHTPLRPLHLLIGVVALAGCLLPEAWAAPVSLTRQRTHTVVLPIGRSTLLRFSRMRRVEVIQPDIVEVVVASLNDLSLHGKAPGFTTVYIWDTQGIHGIEVTVTEASPAERAAQDLSKVLGPRLTYTVCGDTSLVVEI